MAMISTSRATAAGKAPARARATRPVREVGGSLVENVEYITASHSYHDNTAFGGQLFAWMDNAVTIAVMKHSGRKAVTASVDALYFLKPVQVGYIVNVQARIIATFKTSCQVRSVVSARLPQSDAKSLIAVGYFTMVVVGEDGRPETLPPLEASTAADRRLRELAVELRQARPALRQRLLEDLVATGTS
jgi:acyl-CoA hydrolase